MADNKNKRKKINQYTVTSIISGLLLLGMLAFNFLLPRIFMMDSVETPEDSADTLPPITAVPLYSASETTTAEAETDEITALETTAAYSETTKAETSETAASETTAAYSETTKAETSETTASETTAAYSETTKAETSETTASETTAAYSETTKAETTVTSEEFTAATEEAKVEYYTFRSKKLYDDHFEKHGKEFGSITKQEYLDMANELINSKSERVLHKYSADNDYLYFNQDNNYFLVLSEDGYIRTFFIPNKGIEYWNKQ